MGLGSEISAWRAALQRAGGRPALRASNLQDSVRCRGARRSRPCDLADVGSGQPEALLWVTDWSVWPSSEHMPLADAVRRGLGEDRPLSDAPGCLVRLGEDDQALAVLVTAVLFLWDCWVLSPDGTLAAFFSHDEYGVICGFPDVPDRVRRSLDTLGLLKNSEAG